MKTTAWAALAVLVTGLVVTELAMELSPEERQRLYGVFAATTGLTIIATVALVSLTRRSRTLLTSLRMVAFGAVAMTGLVVGAGAFSMIIDPHDLSVVLVALLLGLGLGGVLASAIGRSLAKDLDSMSHTARRVEKGDLTARIDADRADELGAAAAAFDEMVGRLEANELERRQLFAAISHDLRSPLASIQAAIEAVQDGLAPDPGAYLRGVSHDLAYLNRLVDDLFLVARMDAGRLELTPTDVDLAELADEAVEAVTPIAAANSVQLKIDGPGRIRVRADPAALGRVLRNILGNAVRHSPPAGEVRVDLAVKGQWAEAAIVDQGRGFSEEPVERAFERFVRADEARNRDSGGSGLGLAIAKGLVEAHGGSIMIDPGPGGRVRFTLPAAHQSSATDGEIRITQPAKP